MLFDPSTGQFFLMNPTMAAAWRQCDGRSSTAAIAQEIATTFQGVDPVQAEADVTKALEDMLKLGLLVDTSI